MQKLSLLNQSVTAINNANHSHNQVQLKIKKTIQEN